MYKILSMYSYYIVKLDDAGILNAINPTTGKCLCTADNKDDLDMEMERLQNAYNEGYMFGVNEEKKRIKKLI